MRTGSFQGDFAETPFAHVLALILREERSGVLRIRNETSTRCLVLTKGSFTIEQGTFDEQGFLGWLAALGTAPSAELERARDAVQRNGSSLARALIQLGVFPAARLWDLIELFSKSEIYTLFNWGRGEYAFEPRDPGEEAVLVSGISIAGLILEGVRRMGNFDIIEKNLPSPGSAIQSARNRAQDAASLAPHERYILDSTGRTGSFEELCRTSALGERETRRVLFALLALGFLETSPAGGRNGKPVLEFSMGDMDRLFGAFNDKFSFIFKYISKELGPVAPNIIEKSLAEIKDRIDPVFQNCEVKPDGKIELRSLIRKNLGVSSDEGKRSLLRSFDEILAAEVLAVKRTLGNSHEAALIKGMERIGDPR